jgi:prevent-host-death family protein
MAIRSEDIVSISDARSKLAELAEEVVREGAEKILTKNGAGYVALIDAQRLDYYHALENDFAELDMVLQAHKGLDDIAADRLLDGKQLRNRVNKKIRAR